MLEYTYESGLESDGYLNICGVDEAGRGPLCGPVAAAACILPCGLYIKGLNDSKKLSESARERLFDVIRENAVAYCVAFATVEEINEYNILEATLMAMHRAVDGLSPAADYALIDGNIARGFRIPVQTVIHGDATCPCIAAASILAKVSRDRLCREFDEKYPGYGIAKNKGYGTRDHMDALRKLGPTPIHRKLFVRFLDEEAKRK